MTQATFTSTDWETAPKHAIYREKIFEIATHAKREKLLALRGVYPNQPARFLTWVRCENADFCHHPELRSTCCDSPVTTYHPADQATLHQCSYCLSITKTKEALPPAT